MNIDFIKWMCKKADGFKSPDGRTIYFGGSFVRIDSDYTKLFYPLLLQRAIEGVNKSKSIWFVLQDCSMVKVYPHAKEALNHQIKYFYLEHMKPDKAKISALEYIYNQEKNS